MNKGLQRIANTLVLYSYHIQNGGLLNGKMGIILFLYRYAEYSGCEYYREFADKLLDNVLVSVAHIPVDFEDGLSGIGWTVNYLIKGGLVDGDPDDVLQDVDKKVFSSYRCNPQTSIFGQGIYLIERLKDHPSNVDFEKRVIESLDFCEKGIGGYKGVISLYHINSILFFLLNIENNLSGNGAMDSIKKHLPKNLKSVFKDRIFDDADLYIFKRILDEIDSKQKTGWNTILSFQIPELSGDFDIETMIRISWQEILYFGNSKLKEIPFDDSTHFIDSKQESLAINDFLFARGLAGLGNMLLAPNGTP
jgi:hypothetical protein